MATQNIPVNALAFLQVRNEFLATLTAAINGKGWGILDTTSFINFLAGRQDNTLATYGLLREVGKLNIPDRETAYLLVSLLSRISLSIRDFSYIPYIFSPNLKNLGLNTFLANEIRNRENYILSVASYLNAIDPDSPDSKDMLTRSASLLSLLMTELKFNERNSIFVVIFTLYTNLEMKLPFYSETPELAELFQNIKQLADDAAQCFIEALVDPEALTSPDYYLQMEAILGMKSTLVNSVITDNILARQEEILGAILTNSQAEMGEFSTDPMLSLITKLNEKYPQIFPEGFISTYSQRML